MKYIIIRYLILFLSGICTAMPMIFPDVWIISFVSLIPFIFILNSRTVFVQVPDGKRRVISYGLTFGAGFYGTLYSWFITLYPLDFLGLSNGASVAVVVFAWIGISLVQSLQFALLPFFYRILRPDKALPRVFTISSMWVMIEWVQTQTWLGLPWSRLAVSQYKNIYGIQSASLLGSFFIGFIIVIANALFAEALIGLKIEKARKKMVAAVIAVAVIFSNQLFGAVRLAVYSYSNSDKEENIGVAVIQANIPADTKWDSAMLSDIVSKQFSLTREASEKYKAKMIVWSETVIPVVLNRYPELIYQISELSKETGAIIISGAFYAPDEVAQTDDVNGKLSDKVSENEKIYNAVITFYPDGSYDETPYFKRHLVPFGEYMPLKGFLSLVFPFMQDINAFGKSLEGGNESELIDTEFGKIGALICFDSIYETLSTNSVRDGAELITILTNDSWYKDSPAVWQHNAHAVIRAVENGRYVVRAANTGVSSVILPSGEISEHLPPLTEGILFGEIRFLSGKTLYTRFGNIIVSVSLMFLVFEISRKIIDGRKKSGKQREDLRKFRLASDTAENSGINSKDSNNDNASYDLHVKKTSVPYENGSTENKK